MCASRQKGTKVTNGEPSKSSGFRIMCVVVALFCFVITWIVSGIHYFSVYSLREELREIKDLIVEANCPDIPMNNISNLLNEIRGENAALIKSLEAELKDIKSYTYTYAEREIREKNQSSSQDANHECKARSQSCEDEINSTAAGKHPDAYSTTENEKSPAIKYPYSDDSEGTTNDGKIKFEEISLVQFEPGDNVELKVVQRGGTTALYPGVVAEVNDVIGQETTYNIVKFETSVIIKDLKRDQFRKYQVYPKGTKAFLSVFSPRQCRKNCVDHHEPIAIMDHRASTSHGVGSELHGKYTFSFTGDRSTGEIQEAQALRVHRLLEE